MKKFILYTSLLGVITLGSCTKLDENVYNSIIATNFYNNRTEVMAAVLRPFTHASAWVSFMDNNNYWRLNELTADQVAWPQKGRHGYDGAQWIRLHNHEWTVTDNTIKGPWDLIWQGIGFCNNTIQDLEKVDFVKIGMTADEKTSIIAETKVLRAWHYLKLIDIYGNIPIVTTVGTPLNPPTKTRKEVFDFIEKEIKDNVELLKPLSANLVGRVSKAAGYAMLSELYLNAEVWTGTPRWDDCIAASDKIIGGQVGGLNGNADLDPDIYAPFGVANDKSKENLFQIAYDFKAADWRLGFEGLFWHYNQKQINGTDRNGNNAVVVVPSAFDAYKDTDLRKQKWFLIGPQYKYGSTTDPVLGTEEYNNKPLVFVKEIRRNSEGETGEGGMTRGEENSGARFNKYQVGLPTDASYWANDFVLYRITEAYYNKAEALMRKNGNVATQEVVDLINKCIVRRFSAADYAVNRYTIATLTPDEFLAERGREFVFEGKRREDMVRFGKFTTNTWWDHKPTTATKALFPIPSSQIAINPGIKQNPGY
ncbi:RagB/SusD family nutrient uptake outer membrane protein [Pedobacter rhodius]|uniref:RagB/SusD family nutrient uptake outer membrane protein n=1 Tax=Pedobacter rhodius TaxID=3004098 RepID=A0ABT4L233_9SPHI|nr:RagB/SusD family nutrient uptake outer membrane protein [Pedobacter sp. SJ11]MCZ4225243.1 RagB/SusD family nutrient uptake outer membrane protein [Pedobacter sp. SJ11]